MFRGDRDAMRARIDLLESHLDIAARTGQLGSATVRLGQSDEPTERSDDE